MSAEQLNKIHSNPHSSRTRFKVGQPRPWSKKQGETMRKVFAQRPDLREKSRQTALKYLKHHNYQDTEIERCLEAWLDENRVPYEKQKVIEGRTKPDFFIMPNVCIYADGDYWHNLPEIKKKDERINKELISKGYRVVRLWESEIKKGTRPTLLKLYYAHAKMPNVIKREAYA